MDPAVVGAISAVVLLAGMLCLLETGWRSGRRHAAEKGAFEGSGTIEGAVFALLGLLVAFTFSAAMSRFDVRRQLIVQEVNAVGTAFLRIDLLPQGDQPAVRALFRSYLDARLATYASSDERAVQSALQRADDAQEGIWARVIASMGGPQTLLIGNQVVPSLNEMFDIAEARILATRTHMPAIVFVMLFSVALLSAFLAGYAMAGRAKRSWAHIVSFSTAVALTFYVIVDIEYPRRGLVRVEDFDQALVELRQKMNDR